MHFTFRTHTGKFGYSTQNIYLHVISVSSFIIILSKLDVSIFCFCYKSISITQNLINCYFLLTAQYCINSLEFYLKSYGFNRKRIILIHVKVLKGLKLILISVACCTILLLPHMHMPQYTITGTCI